MIYKLKNYACKSFSAFFHLWGGGGLDWHRDYALWLIEQESEWTTVGSKFKKSFADVVRLMPPAAKKTPFLRFQYPVGYQRNFVGSDFSFLKRHKVFSKPPLHLSSTKFNKSGKPPIQKVRVLRWIKKSNLPEKAPAQEKTVASFKKARSKE